jgi:hypothetical protein
MAVQATYAPLSLLSFGCSPTIARAFEDRMCSQDVDATALVIENKPVGDAEIARSITSRNWSCWMVGPGLMQDRVWFERVIKIVKNTNPNIYIYVKVR